MRSKRVPKHHHRDAKAIPAPAIRVQKTDAAGGAKLQRLDHLLGTRQMQETAWLHAIARPEKYAARVPVGVVTGAIPVEMYRAPARLVNHATNAAGEAFVLAGTDQWHDGVQILKISSDVNGGVAGCATSTGYTPTTFPTIGVFPTGVAGLKIDAVSSDFTQSASSGTEYIMVGAALEIEMTTPPSGSTLGFTGYVDAFYTRDPVRYAINGAAPAALWTEAAKEGSQITAARYGITSDGRFYLRRVARPGSGEQNPHRSTLRPRLHLFNVPESLSAFEWKRISGPAQNGGIGANMTTAFYINAPSGTKFDVTWTGLWQTEEYPSSRVTNSNFNQTDVTTQATELQAIAHFLSKATHFPGLTASTQAPPAAVISHYANSQPGFMQNLLNKGIKGLDGLVTVEGAKALYNTLSSWWRTRPHMMAARPPLMIGAPSHNWAGSTPLIEDVTGSAEAGAESILPSMIEEAETIGAEVLPLLAAAL